MLPLLKKKSNAPAGPVVPAWHPNFRDYEKLPDVKVVRTAFFLNGAAIAIALALGIYFGKNEWQLHEVNSQIAEAEQQIERDKKKSDAAVALFRRYQGEAAKVTEVEAFAAARPVVSDILLHIARTLPPDVALDAVEVRPLGVSLRLTVRGSPELAAGRATAYLEQLRTDKELTAFDREKFEFTNQARNTATGRLAVEFFLRFNENFAEKR